VERIDSIKLKRGQLLLEDSNTLPEILETVVYAGRECKEYESWGQKEGSIQSAEL